MSDPNKVVQITDYKVSVAHHFDNSKLELETPFFSEINNFYCNIEKKRYSCKAATFFK